MARCLLYSRAIGRRVLAGWPGSPNWCAFDDRKKWHNSRAFRRKTADSPEFEQTVDEKDRNAILMLLDKWRLATKAKDIQAILDLVADDVVFLPSSVPPIKGKEEVERMY